MYYDKKDPVMSLSDNSKRYAILKDNKIIYT